MISVSRNASREVLYWFALSQPSADTGGWKCGSPLLSVDPFLHAAQFGNQAEDIVMHILREALFDVVHDGS